MLIAIYELFEISESRHCLKYLYNNFKLVHKGLSLKDATYSTVRATTVPQFNKEMKELENIDNATFN